MTPERSPKPAIEPAESSGTVQLLVADAGNRSAIAAMLDERFEVETSQSVTDADLYLVEDHRFPEYRAALRERIDREHPVFCPVVLIRREGSNVTQGRMNLATPDGPVQIDDVVDAPIDPQLLVRRLNSLLVRRHQSRALVRQVSTLEEREQRLRRFEQAVGSTGNGIVMTDPDGTIEYVNPALEGITGYKEADAIGESPQILLPEGSGDVFDEAFWRTMGDRTEWEGDIVIERKDSQRRVVNATATALRDAEEEPEGFVIVLSDITERIQRKRELEDREEELELLRQVLTRYLRHNLRNDLNVILGNAQLLKDDETLSPTHRELIETIIENAESLIGKSDTARTYSSLLERKAELSRFDLSEIATAAVQTVRERHPEVDFEIDVPETCEIHARNGIQRAFEELLENAARHNDAPDPWIRVQVRDRDEVRLVIEDNGPGIPEQERATLARGKETKLSHSEGIGLWLSKWLIEGVDGRLSIETIDTGTRVTVALPPSDKVGSSGLEVTTLKERERRLQTITDRMTDAILEIDADWTITRLDERAERILDVDADTVIGHSLWDEFADLRDSQFEAVVREAMESRSSTSVEEEFVAIDAWLEINVYPEFGGGLSFYIRDVTERKERETALQETSQRLETIIELSPEPIVAVDSAGIVSLWNRAAEDVFGYAADEAIGERLRTLDLFGDEQSSRVQERFERVVSGETIRGLEVERRRKDGTTIDLKLSATPLHSPTDEETGMITVVQDITQLKDRERDLQERVKELSAIHDATELFQTVDAPMEEILSAFVEKIPRSFQYPDITAARLRYNGIEVSTTDFEAREHTLTAHADLDDGATIELEVGYLSDSEIDDDRPFLAEEEALLETLVTVVRNHVQRRSYLTDLERTEDLLTNAETLGDVGAWEVDLETHDVFWTDGARRIHGVSAGFDPTSEEAMEFFHPDDRESVIDAIETCGKSGDSFTHEARIRTADGEQRWIHIEGEPVQSEGESPRVRGYIQDITERKERNRRYEAIFNHTYQFTGLLEPDGTLIEANDTALEFGGITREDVLGKKVWNAHWFEISPETQRQTRADVRRAAAGEFVRRELEVQGKDTTLIIDFSIRPITDEDGNVVLLVPEGRDITSLKDRERELKASKKRYQTMLEAAPDPVFVADAETGEIIETNAAAESLLGESSEEIVGSDQRTLHPSTDAELYRLAFENYDETRETVDTLRDGSRPELVTADGETVPIEISVSTVALPEGPVRFAIFRDVSERVERERDLEQTNAFLSALFETVPAGIVVLDTDGKITRANSHAEAELGLVESEITDRTYRDPEWVIFDEDGGPIADEELPFAQVMETGEMVVDYQHGIERPDGSKRWLSINAAPITGDDGDIEKVIAVITDETDLHEYQQTLETKTERLAAYAGTVSHDLRNPLNVAEGRLKLAQEEYDSEHLDAIERAHDRMNALITDLLTLAREGDGAIDLATVDLAGLVENCWRSVDVGDATVVVEMDESIRADENRLRQLFENLFRNAVEHGSTSPHSQARGDAVEHGSTSPHSQTSEDAGEHSSTSPRSQGHEGAGVTVTIGRLADGFYVEDDGRGIPAGERTFMFEPGYSPKGDGEGFGLSIVKRIADAHGWEIRVTESAAGGARFEFGGVEFVSE